MKITNKISLAAAVMTGLIATGCSNTAQIEGAAQIEAPIMAKAVEVAPPRAMPKRAPARVVKKAPVKRYNRWGHHHPAIPRCTKSVRHTHKYNNANHRHAYGCRNATTKRTAVKPPINVRALQEKLAGKGYYKGPIDGIVGPATRSALERFMKR